MFLIIIKFCELLLPKLGGGGGGEGFIKWNCVNMHVTCIPNCCIVIEFKP